MYFLLCLNYFHLLFFLSIFHSILIISIKVKIRIKWCNGIIIIFAFAIILKPLPNNSITPRWKQWRNVRLRLSPIINETFSYYQWQSIDTCVLEISGNWLTSLKMKCNMRQSFSSQQYRQYFFIQLRDFYYKVVHSHFLFRLENYLEIPTFSISIYARQRPTHKT